MLMIAGLLAGLLADLVFDAVTSARPSFGTAMDRYLDRRGFATVRKPAPTPAR
jgi:hypothetical protein